MSTITVPYTHPGLLRISHDLEIQFRRGTPTPDTLRLEIQVHFDQLEHMQEAEDFYFPLFLTEAADTIRAYFAGKGQRVDVFDRQLRPGLEGRVDFLGVTREQLRTQLMDFRRRVMLALAALG